MLTQLHNLWFCNIAVMAQNFEVNSCLASPMSTEGEALILHVILQYRIMYSEISHVNSELVLQFFYLSNWRSQTRS